MKDIPYYLTITFIRLLTLLPLRVLFIFSDFLYVLLFHIAGYRRNVVMKNLRNAFPEKQGPEINKIARKFYMHLTDSFIESVYQINMKEKEHARRYVFKNPEALNELYREGRSVLLLMSHYGNWEWLSLLPRFTRHTNLAIYKPLQNKKFNRLFLRLRERYGVVGVPIKSILRVLHKYAKEGTPVIVYSLADQRPQWKNTRYWARFLNQDTAIMAGTEKICRRYDLAVVFLKVNKVRRGTYEAEFIPLCLNPGNIKEFEITRKYLDTVESIIREKPQYWLWSHNRWKYMRLPSKDPVDIDEVLSH